MKEDGGGGTPSFDFTTVRLKKTVNGRGNSLPVPPLATHYVTSCSFFTLIKSSLA